MKERKYTIEQRPEKDWALWMKEVTYHLIDRGTKANMQKLRKKLEKQEQES
jgi:hypothetical protein